MEHKVLHGSSRGLTFSFHNNGAFAPGQKYRYIVDVKNREILILPSENGGNTISMKKTASVVKSLIDIRSLMVREMVSSSDYISVDIAEDKISVRVYDLKATASEGVISLESCREAGFEVASSCLMAAGSEMNNGILSDWVDFQGQSETPFDMVNVQKDLNDVVIPVISLFSGAGMLDYVFHKDSRFKIVYAAEYDADAVQTYQKNIGDHIHLKDIRTLHGADLPPAELVIGGPPCQPYSSANRYETSRGEQHPEGDMFYHYVRILTELLPKVFVLENVPMILTEDNGQYMRYLQDSLPDYEIAAKVISDSDVGGYTLRKRAVVIGSRTGTPIIPDIQIFPRKTAGEALVSVNETWPNWKDVTISGKSTVERIALIPEGGNFMDLPEELRTKGCHSNMYRRLDRKKPSVSLANWRKYLLSPPKWDDTGAWDRILSVAEASALQGFGPEFRFCGSLNAKQQQVANGVPVALGRFIKRIVKKIFENEPEFLSAWA